MNRKWLGRLLLAILRVIPKKYPVASSSIAIPEPFFIISSGRSGSTLLNRLLNQHSQLFLPSEQYFIHNLIIKFQLYNWILWRDLGKILAGEIVNSLGAHTWDWDFEETYSKIVLAKGEERTLKWLIDHIIRNYASQMGSEPTLWGRHDTTELSVHSRDLQRLPRSEVYLSGEGSQGCRFLLQKA